MLQISQKCIFFLKFLYNKVSHSRIKSPSFANNSKTICFKISKVVSACRSVSMSQKTPRIEEDGWRLQSSRGGGRILWKSESQKVRKFGSGVSSLMWFSWVENSRGLQGIVFQHKQSVFTTQAVMAWFNLLYNVSIIFCRGVCLKWIWEKPQQFSECPLNPFLPPF